MINFDFAVLVSAKKNDYLIFKQCFELIKEGEHLNEKGLLKIISLKHSLNLGLPKNIIEAFKDKIDNISFERKKSPFLFTGIPDPYWLSGFTSGDGSFNLKLGKSNLTSIGFRVQLRFGIGLHIRELELIKGIASYLNLLVPISKDKYKYIEERSNRKGENPSVLFQITKFSDISNIIIPFFLNYPIEGQKALDFLDFKKVNILMKNNDHLTKEGFIKILEIKENMNKNRKTID